MTSAGSGGRASVPSQPAPSGGDVTEPNKDAGQPPAAGASASDASTPTADASTPTADASMPMADCTPVAWTNPGKVGMAKLSEIPADAGEKKRPFESIGTLKDNGYEWKEFLFSNSSPAYTTRMFVKKPSDPVKFSGTVFVEWYNVSGGMDFPVLWANSQEYFMREGHVFVAVSAQAVGANALKSTVDAQRYAQIMHPGDTNANTIFSQAGAALRTQTETLLGPCMPVRALIGVGQSQSSMRLADYVNNAQARDQVYDGLMLHSGREPANNNPAVKTFVVFTMSEGNGALRDGPNLVEWMVAGATHNDKRVTSRGAEVAEVVGVPLIECANPMNDFPSYRVYNAALEWLNRWVRKGEKPPAGMPFQMRGNQLAMDDRENVLGGVRSPDIDVPIATHGFDNGPKDPTDIIGLLACGLGGRQIPFTAQELMALYPTHEDYVMKYTAAADQAVAAGFWLQADRDEAVKQAQAAPIPR